MLAPHFASLIATAFPIPLDPPVTWNKDKLQEVSNNQPTHRLLQQTCVTRANNQDYMYSRKALQLTTTWKPTTTWALLTSVFFFVKKSKVKMPRKPASTAIIIKSSIVGLSKQQDWVQDSSKTGRTGTTCKNRWPNRFARCVLWEGRGGNVYIGCIKTAPKIKEGRRIKKVPYIDLHTIYRGD